jgi:hypothetical protein
MSIVIVYLDAISSVFSFMDLSKTCRYITLRGPNIIAQCINRTGIFKLAHLDINPCIGNNNGLLEDIGISFCKTCEVVLQLAPFFRVLIRGWMVLRT